MKHVSQKIEDILASLRPVDVGWEDETSQRVIDLLKQFPSRETYNRTDLKWLLDQNFDVGLLICRLFLGRSKDRFMSELKEELGPRGIGRTRYYQEPETFLDALERLGVLDAISMETNRAVTWHDILVERLRFGRGSAISGMRRGRNVEDFVENIVHRVFGEHFEKRCNFVGMYDRQAKCDFAIPNRTNAEIIIEAKGYAATGSKQTDILGDMEKIIYALRQNQDFLFFTDGLTWNARKNDLRKIIAHQNEGTIRRIYTYEMADQLETDLIQLRREHEV